MGRVLAPAPFSKTNATDYICDYTLGEINGEILLIDGLLFGRGFDSIALLLHPGE